VDGLLKLNLLVSVTHVCRIGAHLGFTDRLISASYERILVFSCGHNT
jgi:hypothetical protein